MQKYCGTNVVVEFDPGLKVMSEIFSGILSATYAEKSVSDEGRRKETRN